MTNLPAFSTSRHCTDNTNIWSHQHTIHTPTSIDIHTNENMDILKIKKGDFTPSIAAKELYTHQSA